METYAGGTEPIRAAVRHGAYPMVALHESYGTEDIVGEAIQGRRAEVFLATKGTRRDISGGQS